MKNLKCGKQSFIPYNPPTIINWATTAGKKESEGPLKKYFDYFQTDTSFGEKTWEQAEKRMQQITLNTLLQKSGLQPNDIGLVLSGDLLNQCVSSSMSVSNMNISHLGLYGACSTMAEGLLIATMIVSGGFSDNVVAMTSSHFASSERQYRFPLGYGGQRTPTAQWTVTGSGAALISSVGDGPKITACTIGTVVDQGVCDANNMGAAMAPAALATIRSHFQDLSLSADDYDLIITGDLGETGKDILLTLAQKEGLSLAGKLVDCGTIIFDINKQDVHSGGSGCGCSATVLCSYYLNKLKNGKLKKVLFCGTGALLSPTSCQQGIPIPGVCHAVAISGG